MNKEYIFNEVANFIDNFNNEEIEYIIDSIKFLLEERKREEKEIEDLYN